MDLLYLLMIRLPPPWSFTPPVKPEEEGALMNITLGYEVLPLCLGQGKICLPLSHQMWAYILPPLKSERTRMGLMTALSFNFGEVNIADTLGKSDDPICNNIFYKHYVFKPIHWSRCQSPHGKILLLNGYKIGDPTESFLIIVLKILIAQYVIIFPMLLGIVLTMLLTSIIILEG